MQETDFLQWIILALVQGLTEYLPISSSAHLILISKIAGFKDQGLVMDVAAHSGSLLAVMWYFKKELAKLFKGQNWTLFNQLALATIPLAICGYVFSDFIENNLRHLPMVLALSSIFFGILLFLADKKQKSHNSISEKDQKIGTKNALLIGLSQICALIPGASRSGVTMTSAMAMGYSRSAAARFSFLLAIPALILTTGYGILKVSTQPSQYHLMGVLTVLVLSFLASLLSIKLFLKLIEKIPITVFMWYRIALGILIMALIQ